MAKGECALCKKYTSLRKSHIIPKFVSKWLKETSATGFLRIAKKPEKRIQDLPTLPLLCGECEQRFSKVESYFASKIFYPILNKHKEEIDYDERLLRFILSISWRTLKTSYSNQVKIHPWIKKHLDQAEEIWRKYLLNKSLDSGLFEHHLFFIDYVKRESGMPRKFQWYSLRATDSTLASSQYNVIAFTHFPHVFIVSTIFPFSFPSWNNTKIRNNGRFNVKTEIQDNYFWEFLIDRNKILLSAIEDSDERSWKYMNKTHPERFLNSESFTVMIEESKRERLKRMEKLPEGIKALIDIVDSSVDNTELNSFQQRWKNFTQYMVANALLNISSNMATKIDSQIQSTITLASKYQTDTRCDFETQELIARFMVTSCGTKNQLIKKLQQAVEELIKKKDDGDQRIIVVFSFNPLDDKILFEIALG